MYLLFVCLFIVVCLFVCLLLFVCGCLFVWLFVCFYSHFYLLIAHARATVVLVARTLSVNLIS